MRVLVAASLASAGCGGGGRAAVEDGTRPGRMSAGVPAPTAGAAAADRAAPALPMDPGAEEAEGALLRYLETGDPADLAAARAAAARVVAEYPELTYGRLLAADAARRAGDAAAEAAALGPLSPESRAAYELLFRRDDDVLRADLACLRVNSCLWRASVASDEERLDDPFQYVLGAGGEITCGGRALDPASCPPTFEVLGRLSWVSHAANRLEQWSPYHLRVTFDDLFGLVDIGPGMAVADVGAGLGYFTFPLGRVVGASGRVTAVDVDPRFCDFLRELVRLQGLSNVDVVRGLPGDTRLPPASQDRVFVCETLAGLVAAEGEDPGGSAVPDLLASMRASLAPGGTLIVADHHAAAAGGGGARVTTAALIARIERAGFVHRRTLDEFLPVQAVMIFDVGGAP